MAIPFSRDSAPLKGPTRDRPNKRKAPAPNAPGSGRNLRRVRVAQNLSVDALAELARLSPGEIVSIEAGTEPELETLWALAVALDVSFLELVREAGPNSRSWEDVIPERSL